jgi:hypothetical protein
MFAVHDGGGAEAAAERLLHACHHLLSVNLHNLILSNSVPNLGIFFTDPDPSTNKQKY